MAGEKSKEALKTIPDGEVLWQGKLGELGTDEQRSRVAEDVCGRVSKHDMDRETCKADIKGLLDIYVKGKDSSVDAYIRLTKVPRLEIGKEGA